MSGASVSEIRESMQREVEQRSGGWMVDGLRWFLRGMSEEVTVE